MDQCHSITRLSCQQRGLCRELKAGDRVLGAPLVLVPDAHHDSGDLFADIPIRQRTLSQRGLIRNLCYVYPAEHACRKTVEHDQALLQLMIWLASHSDLSIVESGRRPGFASSASGMLMYVREQNQPKEETSSLHGGNIGYTKALMNALRVSKCMQGCYTITEDFVISHDYDTFCAQNHILCTCKDSLVRSFFTMLAYLRIGG